MRILFLSRWFPDPPNNGSKIRILNLLKGLSKDHRVTLISFYDPDEGAPQLAAIQSLCAEVRLVPWQEPQSGEGSWFGYLHPNPKYFVDSFSHAMRSEIVQVIENGRFDRVIASQVDMAAYASSFNGLPALFEEAEVSVLFDQYIQADHPLERLRFGLTWVKHRRFLNRLMQYFRECTVVSEQERQLLKQFLSPKTVVRVVPNCVDLENYQGNWGSPRPSSLVFTGSFTYTPNYDGMLWFLRHVYPAIRQQEPAVQISITGNHAGLPLPTSDGVVRTGYLEDVRPLIAGSMCSIVPILDGGGTRLKVLEAMALGTPVVATSKGAEGLQVVDKTHLLIADDPAEFGRAVLRLLNEPELRSYLAANAQELVKKTYDWRGILPGFVKLVENIGYN